MKKTRHKNKKQSKTTHQKINEIKISRKNLQGITLESYLKKRYPTKKARAEADSRYNRLYVGYEIYLARKKRNITQKQLAKKTKTQQSVIARIEAGKQNLSTDKLNEIGEVLGFELCLKKK